ncbi:MAG: 1-acyl-sn-glycerol-3-phosphate acyltransferase [Acidobacterium ailaaui]|nr:1-acyl-sn-glycerol-3-phosphate acyltransferase [Pseudacidobacterium ailaaui]
MRYTALRLRRPRPTLYDRACWLHETASMLLRRIGITVRSEGPVPELGLIVSNHLGYLDIPLHAALGPRVFVSKQEVASWPIFGLLARLGGTIFLKRGNRLSATEAAIEVEFALRSNVPVVLFPEGTSTDGTTLLPFHTFLFEPAIETESAVSAAAVRYDSAGAEERDLCYYGEIHFAPHLMETLARKQVSGLVRFDGRSKIYSHRKLAANDCWERVARLRLNAQRLPHADMAGQWL